MALQLRPVCMQRTEYGVKRLNETSSFSSIFNNGQV